MAEQAELIRNLVATCRDELMSLTDTECGEGYAAEDEIEDAVDHLDAAIVDLDRGMEQE